ncbi:MAG TPA: hypothetical protein DEW37_07950 [Oscillibacter sp.]|nr:hypothetical protein [Oscillibacter sp.]
MLLLLFLLPFPDANCASAGGKKKALLTQTVPTPDKKGNDRTARARSTTLQLQTMIELLKIFYRKREQNARIFRLMQCRK